MFSNLWLSFYIRTDAFIKMYSGSGIIARFTSASELSLNLEILQKKVQINDLHAIVSRNISSAGSDNSFVAVQVDLGFELSPQLVLLLLPSRLSTQQLKLLDSVNKRSTWRISNTNINQPKQQSMYYWKFMLSGPILRIWCISLNMLKLFQVIK